MSERRELIDVEVQGKNPDELIAAARAEAVRFWGSDYGITVGDIYARPLIRGTYGTEIWTADVRVTRVARDEAGR